jgi:hypothetical protein
MYQKLSNIHIYPIRNLEDTSNFTEYPDSDDEVLAIAIKPEADPFINW